MVDMLANVGKTLLGIVILAMIVGAICGLGWVLSNKPYIIGTTVLIGVIVSAGYGIGDEICDLFKSGKRGDKD